MTSKSNGSPKKLTNKKTVDYEFIQNMFQKFPQGLQSGDFHSSKSKVKDKQGRRIIEIYKGKYGKYIYKGRPCSLSPSTVKRCIALLLDSGKIKRFGLRNNPLYIWMEKNHFQNSTVKTQHDLQQELDSPKTKELKNEEQLIHSQLLFDKIEKEVPMESTLETLVNNRFDSSELIEYAMNQERKADITLADVNQMFDNIIENRPINTGILAEDLHQQRPNRIPDLKERLGYLIEKSYQHWTLFDEFLFLGFTTHDKTVFFDDRGEPPQLRGIPLLFPEEVNNGHFGFAKVMTFLRSKLFSQCLLQHFGIRPPEWNQTVDQYFKLLFKVERIVRRVLCFLKGYKEPPKTLTSLHRESLLVAAYLYQGLLTLCQITKTKLFHYQEELVAFREKNFENPSANTLPSEIDRLEYPVIAYAFQRTLLLSERQPGIVENYKISVNHIYFMVFKILEVHGEELREIWDKTATCLKTLLKIQEEYNKYRHLVKDLGRPLPGVCDLCKDSL